MNTEEQEKEKQLLYDKMNNAKTLPEFLHACANSAEKLGQNSKYVLVLSFDNYKCDDCPKTHSITVLSRWIDEEFSKSIGTNHIALAMLEIAKQKVLNAELEILSSDNFMSLQPDSDEIIEEPVKPN